MEHSFQLADLSESLPPVAVPSLTRQLLAALKHPAKYHFSSQFACGPCSLFDGRFLVFHFSRYRSRRDLILLLNVEEEASAETGNEVDVEALLQSIAAGDIHAAIASSELPLLAAIEAPVVSIELFEAGNEEHLVVFDRSGQMRVWRHCAGNVWVPMIQVQITNFKVHHACYSFGATTAYWIQENEKGRQQLCCRSLQFRGNTINRGLSSTITSSTCISHLLKQQLKGKGDACWFILPPAQPHERDLIIGCHFIGQGQTQRLRVARNGNDIDEAKLPLVAVLEDSTSSLLPVLTQQVHSVIAARRDSAIDTQALPVDGELLLMWSGILFVATSYGRHLRVIRAAKVPSDATTGDTIQVLSGGAAAAIISSQKYTIVELPQLPQRGIVHDLDSVIIDIPSLPSLRILYEDTIAISSPVRTFRCRCNYNAAVLRQSTNGSSMQRGVTGFKYHKESAMNLITSSAAATARSSSTDVVAMPAGVVLCVGLAVKRLIVSFPFSSLRTTNSLISTTRCGDDIMLQLRPFLLWTQLLQALADADSVDQSPVPDRKEINEEGNHFQESGIKSPLLKHLAEYVNTVMIPSINDEDAKQSNEINVGSIEEQLDEEMRHWDVTDDIEELLQDLEDDDTDEGVLLNTDTIEVPYDTADVKAEENGEESKQWIEDLDAVTMHPKCHGDGFYAHASAVLSADEITFLSTGLTPQTRWNPNFCRKSTALAHLLRRVQRRAHHQHHIQKQDDESDDDSLVWCEDPVLYSIGAQYYLQHCGKDTENTPFSCLFLPTEQCFKAMFEDRECRTAKNAESNLSDTVEAMVRRLQGQPAKESLADDIPVMLAAFCTPPLLLCSPNYADEHPLWQPSVEFTLRRVLRDAPQHLYEVVLLLLDTEKCNLRNTMKVMEEMLAGDLPTDALHHEGADLDDHLHESHMEVDNSDSESEFDSDSLSGVFRIVDSSSVASSNGDDKHHHHSNTTKNFDAMIRTENADPYIPLLDRCFCVAVELLGLHIEYLSRGCAHGQLTIVQQDALLKLLLLCDKQHEVVQYLIAAKRYNTLVMLVTRFVAASELIGASNHSHALTLVEDLSTLPPSSLLPLYYRDAALDSGDSLLRRDLQSVYRDMYRVLQLLPRSGDREYGAPIEQKVPSDDEAAAAFSAEVGSIANICCLQKQLQDAEHDEVISQSEDSGDSSSAAGADSTETSRAVRRLSENFYVAQIFECLLLMGLDPNDGIFWGNTRLPAIYHPLCFAEEKQYVAIALFESSLIAMISHRNKNKQPPPQLSAAIATMIRLKPVLLTEQRLQELLATDGLGDVDEET